MNVPENAVAVIGLAGRFPGANDVAQFWRNIRAGVTSITRFSDAELEDSFGADIRHNPNFVRARPILKDVDKFDAEFFGMLPREAALTDPQHRLMLECAWTALEDAGYDPATYPGSIGVFAGSSMNTYLLTNVLAERLNADDFASDYQVGSYDALLGALSDTLATRIAYKLNLRGPAMTVQSACSTSLLAIAQACQSLLLYQSDMALAGGVSITFPQKRGYMHLEGGMVSPDGICRPFDANAGGTIFGDGAAVVLLKRLGEAIDDGDHIYAVIRGSAINNDGSDKVGFTAPSVRGQSEVIASAIATAGVEPGTIGYVECHGTATPLGDPIEFDGLVRGFGLHEADKPSCALGSVKANIGHLDAAAGVTGLIKAVMALQHREIPPLTNFTQPNRHIDLAGSPFYFPTSLADWTSGSTPRRAGVSSFGVGGTNVHVVLEEAPTATAERHVSLQRHRHLLPLSARNDAALAEAAAAIADHLAATPESALEDVAHTLQVGRHAFDRRIAIAAGSREEAIQALRTPPPAIKATGRAPLIFMFPGQGAQHAGMARDLHRDHALFRELTDQGIAIASPIVGPELKAQLLDPKAANGDATLFAQPALFIFEYALARLYMSWGFEPDAMVGHSVGEFVAACLGGVFSFEEGCRLVATRARTMQAMPPGAMLAVRLPEAALKAELGDALDIAAVNAPSLCVVSGPQPEIDALSTRLDAQGVMTRRLAVSHAFHSRVLDPVLGDIERAAADTMLATPQRAFVSSVTGKWIDAAQASDPKYWARHGREPVRFADALTTVAREGEPFLLEVGPGRNLSALAAQIVDRRKLRGIAASLPDPESGDLDGALAALWSAGFELDWAALGAAQGRRISLPTYHFQRSRHWIERTARPVVAPASAVAETASAPVPATSVAPAADTTPAARADALQAEIVGILEHLSGVSGIDPNERFVELGFDSLLLGQVARAVEKKFKTRITFRQLLRDMPSAALLAVHLDATLPAGQQQPAPKPPAPTPRLVAPPPQGEAEARVRLYRPSAAKASSALTNTQRDYVETLVRKTNERTPLSKARTQHDRATLADPRTAAGFRQEWKELTYPVIAASAKGSRLRDIDGNDYIDLVNGYGQTLFGHSPDFVTKAIEAQLKDGFPIGPQSPLAGEVASLIAEMTGDERVTFCNTGSEAVMAAMRVARAVTGRERVVVFANDYHGQFDEVLVKAGGGTTRAAVPVAPGIPPESAANMTVLPYGDPASLAWIEANGEEIAAVMVEPVQSRHPDLRPQAFLQKLRALTEASGTALVFDEIVTGFRVHPAGMQSVFGIRADMATYGKVVGGGMPIGILAGKAHFMDALDGGMWRYGDDSIPETAPTFFAGTFVRHPLALAATKAVLLHLKEQGPGLQERLAGRMGTLVGQLNGELERRGLKTRLEAYSSWFYLSFAAEGQLASLFWPQMRQLGVHVQEGYPCFLTTAHSDADIATIRTAFSAALDALEEGGILNETRQSAVAAAGAGESAPLTEPQLEILAAAQAGDDASCAFNESVSIAFEGELDTAALATAVNGVIARHQALRGRVDRSGERMHFAPALQLDLTPKDLSGEADPTAALAALTNADARTAFDLWSGPLARAVVVRLAKDRHILVLTAHHIVCDGWSINILLTDLAALYRAAHTGQPNDLAPAPLFSDYAITQARTKASRADDLRYWTEVFAAPPPLPDLPTDRPRQAQRSYAGATYATTFDADLCNALKKMGAASGTTLFSVLFTSLQAVLGRLSGASDVVMGVPVAGQSVDDVPELVGHCVQMLPFRAPLTWDTPFASQIEATAQRLLDGFDHSRCTYGTLVRALPLQRVANRLPLTEIQFNLERIAEALDFGGLKVDVTPNAKAAVNFDLFVNVNESAAGLRIDCDYNSDLFDETTIARWMTHYRRLLEGVVAAPATPLAALPLLSADQERFVLDSVNETAAQYPADHCIQELFAVNAARTPDAVACIDRMGPLTYAELDRQSTRLAQEILGIMKTRGGRIAIAVDRSRALLIALLAVMKSGHAYVPLDVHQPLERLKQIAITAQIDGIVCLDDRASAIAPHAFPLRLDRINLDGRLQNHTLPKVTTDASAYVLFTSGSTGTPKGVEVSHRALTNLISDVVRRLDVKATDVTIASSAVTFDVAATELFAPLATGGRVVMSEADQVKTGVELVALAKKAEATLMQATPTLWRMLLEAGFASWPGLRMITAGEAISRDTIDRLLAGGGRLWNLYGPTEATVYASGGEMLPGETGITIGKPLSNTQLYVLDDHDRIVPLGVVGHLFIGGDGLAKGYFDNSALTAEAFRTISLAGHPLQRLYRTGDLARLLPSGEFELLGRIDHQVKLRGFRIELQEIESTLRRAPGVRDCAVLLRDDAGPDPMLVAYVVGVPKPAGLATFLKERLPDYMVPARWVGLEAMPITPNGKVDRNALAAPGPAAVEPTSVKPRTPLETRIAAVWAAVIGLPQVGVNDPLFALGADSLQVFRIAAQLDQAGIAISARDLMKNPTVASLAALLDGASAPAHETPVRRAPSLADFRHGARRRNLGS
ncbi:MAG: amino acid adenylation domain-containing protein [Alphaproteobacteria bacterium]|nr:amino acid adenylation domain-containing protein [Alphaproteobacteria bacterium]